METIKLALALFIIGIKSETLALLNAIWKRVQGVWQHLYGLVRDIWAHVTGLIANIVLVPVHVIAWVLGLARAAWLAVKKLWK
jgi:hypothetical protein